MGNAIPRHVYRYIEGELYDYRINRKTLDSYREDIIESTPASDGSGIRSKYAGSTTESKVMMLMTDREILRLQRTVRAVEDTVDVLNQEQREMVKLKYFDNTHTDSGVMLTLHLPDERPGYPQIRHPVRHGVMWQNYGSILAVLRGCQVV
jgi:RinA family phage transcriptional activator